ncbi:energy transducer TonB family protein [Variovorax sp. HJSM1_2]|uniref:energy transducer TonB family protein n=1 Tax=Variovorax sp. HJSM1_2 TaxID=3366263 RepID=UPI003BDBC517
MNFVPPSKQQRIPADAGRWWQRYGGSAIGVLALALLVALMWYLLADTASQKRKVADAPMLMLPPPPPPPPEPEKPPEPTPEKIKPEVVEPKPEPVDTPEPPKDDTPPSPSKDLGDPVTIDGPAQAGTDAFGIGAGKGGGMTGGRGGGLGSGSYGRYVANALQQALARDPRTRQLAFDDIQLDLWLDTEGRTTRVQLVKSTGNTQSDEAVLAMVREMARIDESPPASARFPMRVSMRGRRP